MSRSLKKTPITGNCVCRSEKPYKKVWHGQFRANSKQALDKDEEVLPLENDIANPWCFGKDGKHYMHKDAKKIKKMNRKVRARRAAKKGS